MGSYTNTCRANHLFERAAKSVAAPLQEDDIVVVTEIDTEEEFGPGVALCAVRIDAKGPLIS